MSGDQNGVIQIHWLVYIFPHSSTGVNKGTVSLLCGVQLFVVVWQHFHVAEQNFESLLVR